MKKMFLALALLAVAPVVFADDAMPEDKTEQKDLAPAAKGYLERAHNAYDSVANSVESLFARVPGSSYVTEFVFNPIRSNTKVAMVAVAAAAYVVGKVSVPSEEAEL